MRTVLVTIEGPYGPVDAELAGDVPIHTLAPLILELCGVDASQSVTPQPSIPHPLDTARLAQGGYAFEVGGSQWALECRANEPLNLERSLISCQIVDGMRLTLHDLVVRQLEREQAAQFVPQEVAPSAATGGVGVIWRRG
ncbi:MAG TPA: EsaB/YukD family protein [Ktedonobacterales bacterium]|nr:EsaB/YukD family protein [Ktedonobacterales bacterium]